MGEPDCLPWFLYDFIAVKFLTEFPYPCGEIVEISIGDIYDKLFYPVQIFIGKFNSCIAQCAVQQFGVQFHTFIAVDRKSTRLNSSHVKISYAVICLK